MITSLNVPKGLSVKTVRDVARVPRYPQHPFNIRHKPFQIQPFMIAPVLAGETFKNALMMSRVVTDPIKNRLVGWWVEHYFFYVKLRDLDDRAEIEKMLLDITENNTDLADAVAKASTYHHSGIDWVEKCLKRVTEEYFRDENETYLQAAVDGLPLSKIQSVSWTDSVYPASDMPDVDIPLDATAEEMSAAKFDALFRQWEMMRAHKLTEMDFEDYKATFGVRPDAQDVPHKPELIRYTRNWSYPSNTIADDGSASSAVSWSVSERIDKDRFFKEPGFIFAVTVAKPKVYLGNQREAATHLLNDALAWLPATIKEDVYASIKTLDGDTGPLGGIYTGQNDYVVDVRDLFVHGDQFVNRAITDTMSKVSLPVAGQKLNSVYPTSADLLAFFADSGEAPTKTYVEQDGVVNLTILGTQIDHT